MKGCKGFDAGQAQTVLAYIRQGGFPVVAADAAGIPGPIFLSWLRRGEERGAREPLRGFARAVRQAIAQARLLSELAICKKDPKFWLSHGPGRETLDNAGWTTLVRPRVRQETGEDPIETARALCTWVMEALTPFPEARLKVAELIVAKPPACTRDKKQGPSSASGGRGAGLPSFWSGLDPSLN
jgi:hypothetical protein